MLNTKETTVCDACDPGVHPAVRGLPTELPPLQSNDAKLQNLC